MYTSSSCLYLLLRKGLSTRDVRSKEVGVLANVDDLGGAGGRSAINRTSSNKFFWPEMEFV